MVFNNKLEKLKLKHTLTHKTKAKIAKKKNCKKKKRWDLRKSKGKGGVAFSQIVTIFY